MNCFGIRPFKCSVLCCTQPTSYWSTWRKKLMPGGCFVCIILWSQTIPSRNDCIVYSDDGIFLTILLVLHLSRLCSASTRWQPHFRTNVDWVEFCFCQTDWDDLSRRRKTKYCLLTFFQTEGNLFAFPKFYGCKGFETIWCRNCLFLRNAKRW